MTHSFLMQSGRWLIKGNWLEKDQEPINVKGLTIISLSPGNWFTIVTKLVFPEQQLEEIVLESKGRFHSQRSYSYISKQNVLGRVEGQGWVSPQSIIQRYWVLGDKQRRSGVETFFKDQEDKYYFSSSLMSGHYLTSTMEAILKRQI